MKNTKLLALLLCIVMLAAMFPVSSFAEDETVVPGGEEIIPGELEGEEDGGVNITADSDETDETETPAETPVIPEETPDPEEEEEISAASVPTVSVSVPDIGKLKCNYDPDNAKNIKAVIIANMGDTAITVTNVEIIDDDNSCFSLVINSANPVIDAGETDSISYSVKPAAGLLGVTGTARVVVSYTYLPDGANIPENGTATGNEFFVTVASHKFANGWCSVCDAYRGPVDRFSLGFDNERHYIKDTNPITVYCKALYGCHVKSGKNHFQSLEFNGSEIKTNAKQCPESVTNYCYGTQAQISASYFKDLKADKWYNVKMYFADEEGNQYIATGRVYLSSTVVTGDSANPNLWAAVCLLSVLAAAVPVCVIRTKKQHM